LGPEVLLLDSTILRAHQHSACWRGSYAARAMGRSRGGLSTKFHVAVTSGWQLRAHAITAGHRADIRAAPALLRQVSGPVAAVIADRAYDADAEFFVAPNLNTRIATTHAVHVVQLHLVPVAC